MKYFRRWKNELDRISIQSPKSTKYMLEHLIEESVELKQTNGGDDVENEIYDCFNMIGMIAKRYGLSLNDHDFEMMYKKLIMRRIRHE